MLVQFVLYVNSPDWNSSQQTSMLRLPLRLSD